MNQNVTSQESSGDPNRVGIIGGTGPAGRALATRLALLGRPVVLGSRDAGRAEHAVAEIGRRLGRSDLSLDAVSNADAARCAVVVLAVNAEHTIATASALKDLLDGSIVVTMASTLRRADRGFCSDDSSAGSIAERLQAALGQSRVVAGLHHLPAKLLGDPAVELAADAILCGDDAAAVAVVAEQFDGIVTGRLVDGGVLSNAQALESLTAVLLTLNTRERATYTIRLAAADVSAS